MQSERKFLEVRQSTNNTSVQLILATSKLENCSTYLNICISIRKAIKRCDGKLCESTIRTQMRRKTQKRDICLLPLNGRLKIRFEQYPS